MYTKFFGLAEAPFNITPDSKFLFLSQRHREALSALLYGIRERKGFILLTGEIGSGKTTICRALVQDLRQEDVKLALILNPGLSEIELLKAINDEFQIPSYYNTKKGLVDELNRFLLAENQKGTNVVLVIDEAQNLAPELLEQIRLLSNLETESAKLIQIVLIGQPELNETLSLSQLEQLNQRIAVRYHITPLSPEEMYAYIRHRLFVAQAKVDIEFTDRALALAYEATRGIPRKINVLCDRALLGCYVEGTYSVDERIMQRAIQEVAGSEGGALGISTGRLPKVKVVAPEVRRAMLRRAAVVAGALVGAGLVITAAVALGIHVANLTAGSELAGGPPPVRTTPAPDAGAEPSPATQDTATTPTGHAEQLSTDTVVVAAPTPTPDLEQILRKKPNWKYEKNAPLVRVNNPRTVLRAAQLSLLKAWGINVDLDEMSKISEDLIINGDLKSDTVPIHRIPLSEPFHKVVRYNVPVIVKMKDAGEERSEYVVLLRAEGEAVTVGDPVWGVKTYKTQDFLKRWVSATAICVDVNQLGSIKRGDKSEKVRALQQFLKDEGYLAKPSGTFDIETTEAIKKLQAYYELKQTGELDSMTLLLLNSRMMRNGPRLNAAAGG